MALPTPCHDLSLAAAFEFDQGILDVLGLPSGEQTQQL